MCHPSFSCRPPCIPAACPCPFKLKAVDRCSISDTLRPGLTTALIHTPPILASLLPTIWTNSSFLLYGIKALPGPGPIHYFLFPHYIFPDASLRRDIHQGWPCSVPECCFPSLKIPSHAGKWTWNSVLLPLQGSGPVSQGSAVKPGVNKGQ